MSTQLPGPEASGPDAAFRRALAEGRILLQRSRRDGAVHFYPRITAPGTGLQDLEWIEAAGGGTVYSTTVVRRKAEQGGDYNLALVTLDEGPRLLSQVVDTAPTSVSIGQRVRAHVGRIDGEAVILFRPAEAYS